MEQISNSKKKILLIIIRLFIGFFIGALGIVAMINANLGLSPWDVLHQGLTRNFHITMGQASIVVGVIVVLISMFLGVRIGIGTILNMIVIGYCIQICCKIGKVNVAKLNHRSIVDDLRKIII